MLGRRGFWRSLVRPCAKSRASFKARAGCLGSILLGSCISKEQEAQLSCAAPASADHPGAKRCIPNIQAEFPCCSLPLALSLCTSGKGLAPSSPIVLQAEQFQPPCSPKSCSQPWPATAALRGPFHVTELRLIHFWGKI